MVSGQERCTDAKYISSRIDFFFLFEESLSGKGLILRWEGNNSLQPLANDFKIANISNKCLLNTSSFEPFSSLLEHLRLGG